MCDTFLSLPPHTTTGAVILGKNSDREPAEAQAIVRVRALAHAEKRLRCTFIEIPQVAYTHEVLLSKPFQMWGAEMGVNEHGVAIGNEAVFTKFRFARRNDGLTGMDMLRLALERADSAPNALETILQLLHDHGQDACGGYRNKRFFYHNSFLIADPREGWLLETAGSFWALKQVKGQYSISNGLTIEGDYDRISPGAQDFARKKGWWKTGEEFSFRKSFSDKLMRYFSRCQLRRATTGAGLGGLTVADAMQLLRHHDKDPEHFDPAGATAASVCMHATGLLNPSNTTGSMVAELRPDGRHTVWLTGASMPCLSVYKPFFFGGDSLTEPQWLQPGAAPDASLWWQSEQLHRNLCRDYARGRAWVRPALDRMEAGWLEQEAELIRSNAGAAALDAFSKACLQENQDWLAARLAESPGMRFYRRPILLSFLSGK